MCDKLTSPNVIASNDVIELLINDQSTNNDDIATYVINRVQSCNVLEIPIFFTNIGYNESNDSELSFAKIAPICIYNIKRLLLCFILMPSTPLAYTQSASMPSASMPSASMHSAYTQSHSASSQSPSAYPFIISFDIGIKNLAFSVLSINSGTLNIIDWGIINLSDSVSTNVGPVCNCLLKNGKQCGKKASLHLLDTMYCCSTHAKSCGKLMPSKDLSMPAIKKLKMDELHAFCTQRFIVPGAKKAETLEKVQQYIDKNVLQPIKKAKVKTANQIHLVDIGKRIKQNFDTRFSGYLDKISHVILENQISPIAGRMNTIQGMVAQYFIMQSSDNLAAPKAPLAEAPIWAPKAPLVIDFISSAGKLKGLSDSSQYKDHKKDGIAFCQRFMEANPELNTLKTLFDNAFKKDDLADCFLQGIYYLKKQNIINYSEDLKIKSVV